MSEGRFVVDEKRPDNENTEAGRRKPDRGRLKRKPEDSGGASPGEKVRTARNRTKYSEQTSRRGGVDVETAEKRYSVNGRRTARQDRPHVRRNRNGGGGRWRRLLHPIRAWNDRKEQKAAILADGTKPSSEDVQAELERETHHRRYYRILKNTVSVLIVVAAISVLIATLLLPVLQIYGSSMVPTVNAGDIVISVKGADLQAGDVIGFYYQNTVLVKRVIALAGDWVDIDEDGNVYVNGELLDEPYLEEGTKSYGVVNIELPYQVPEGRVFVLGDHRSTSVDSRTTEVGCIAEENIIGKIIFRIWPFSSFGTVG